MQLSVWFARDRLQCATDWLPGLRAGWIAWMHAALVCLDGYIQWYLGLITVSLSLVRYYHCHEHFLHAPE